MAYGETPDAERVGRRARNVVALGLGAIAAIYGFGIIRHGLLDSVENGPAGPASVTVPTSAPAEQPSGPPCQGSVEAMAPDATDPLNTDYLASILSRQVDRPVDTVLLSQAYCPDQSANNGGDVVTLLTPDGMILNGCVTVDKVGELDSTQYHVVCAG